MNKIIPLGLLTASIAVVPFICNQKVFGKLELASQKNNQVVNVSKPSAYGYIETRNKKIMINTDDTYSIRGKNGDFLVENLTLDELKTQNPELHQIIEDSIAKSVLMMDAGIGINK